MMNEFSKLLQCDPSMGSSFDDDSGEEDLPRDYGLSASERAQIEIIVNRIEVAHFCKDILEGITRYQDERRKISRRRLQDLQTLSEIVSDTYGYRTKEACMMVICDRLDRLKSGWLMFRGKSRLRSIISEIITFHSSPQLKKAREDLMLEMVAHKKLLIKYNYVRGEELEQLKAELANAHAEIRSLKSREVPMMEPVLSQSFVDRFTGLFGKK